jgi:hypothetical protein
MSGPLADAPFDRRVLERELDGLRARLSLRGETVRWMERATGSVVELLDATPGATLQQRWSAIEQDRWARWEAGEQRLAPERQWTWGPAALVLGRAIRPGWELLSRARLSQWLAWLPANDPLERELAWLRDRVGRIEWEIAEGPRPPAGAANHAPSRLHQPARDHRRRSARGARPPLPRHGRARRRLV